MTNKDKEKKAIKFTEPITKHLKQHNILLPNKKGCEVINIDENLIVIHKEAFNLCKEGLRFGISTNSKANTYKLLAKIFYNNKLFNEFELYVKKAYEIIPEDIEVMNFMKMINEEEKRLNILKKDYENSDKVIN